MAVLAVEHLAQQPPVCVTVFLAIDVSGCIEPTRSATEIDLMGVRAPLWIHPDK
eukprot:m.437768 g.437768  ORF g.437768 m.437768 type:complete len:54 (-) comp21439_c0_seq3:1567-1728(-)